MDTTIEERSHQERFNKNLYDSDGEYPVASVIAAYANGAKDQLRFDKVSFSQAARDAFCAQKCSGWRNKECRTSRHYGGACEELDGFINILLPMLNKRIETEEQPWENEYGI